MSYSLRPHGTVARQPPLSMGFPWQEYWSDLSVPPPKDLHDPGIKPISPGSPALEGRFFTTETPEKPKYYFHFTEEEMEAQKSKVICPGSTSENHSALKLHTAHWLPLSLFSHLTPESLRVSSASPAQLLPSLAMRASDPWSAFILILRLNENINHT